MDVQGADGVQARRRERRTGHGEQETRESARRENEGVAAVVGVPVRMVEEATCLDDGETGVGGVIEG